MMDQDRGMESHDPLDKVIRMLEKMVGKKPKRSKLEFPLVVDVASGVIRAVKPDDKIVPMPRRRN
jgi:hypothetical protein